MNSAIVTGATGFIGIHLCEELLSRQTGVTALVRPAGNNNVRLPQDVHIVECGMDDYLTADFGNADIFYHLAWEGATGEGRNNTMLQMRNVGRTVDALVAAKRHGCRRFIAVGTVFERLVPQIVREEKHRQVDFYLLSKQYAHAMCAKLALKLGIEFVWVTIFQPIGKYIKREQVMAYAIKGLLDGEPPAFGPAQEPYDITAAEDIAYGLRLLGEKELKERAYYIGSGCPKRMCEYLTEAKKY